MARDQARPDLEWKVIDGDLADAKRAQTPEPRLLPREGQAGLGGGGAAPWARRKSVTGSPASGRRPRIGQRASDEGSGAGPALEKSFGQELLERGQHRQARDLELARQAARRREPLPRAQAPGQDGLAKTFIELAVERFGRGAVERQEGGDPGDLALHAATIVVLPAPSQVAMVRGD